MNAINLPSTSAILLGIARDLRHAKDISVLRFYLVSEIRRLIDYRQAILFHRQGDRLRVDAVSNVASIDRNAPYIVFLQRAIDGWEKAGRLAEPTALDKQQLPPGEQQEWDEFLAQYAFWQPLTTADDQISGGLLLVRATPWGDVEAPLLAEIADTAAHARAALERPRSTTRNSLTVGKRRWRIALAVAAVAILCLPVRLSVIAPSQIVAKNPSVIASPINGVIKEIHIEPNAEVKRGELLFSYEEAELHANHQIAQLAVREAEAQLRRASQQAFGDPRGRAEVALLQARVALRREQARYSAYQLSQVKITAPADGIAVFNDSNQWRGRPVSTGERVMAIAAPREAELAVFIPVADAIALSPDTEVTLFLDVSPLEPVNARLKRAAYQPMPSPEGVLSYRAVAAFEEGTPPPRIGLKGAAKVEGKRVPLALFLFRRPLAALRQMLGF